MPKVMIRWDDAKRARFRERYHEAVTAGEDQFTFEEHLFLTRYAKYLIDYHDAVFAKQDDHNWQHGVIGDEWGMYGKD